MFSEVFNQFHNTEKPGSFNMTAVIDIVFLLIIFFLVACQFIEAENFPVAVPDGCGFARSEEKHKAQVTTVTVMKGADGSSNFAVGSEEIAESDYGKLTDRLTDMIDSRLKDLPPDRRVVTLRIDKDVCFSDAQYALAGVAASSATDIQLATIKDKHVGLQ